MSHNSHESWLARTNNTIIIILVIIIVGVIVAIRVNESNRRDELVAKTKTPFNYPITIEVKGTYKLYPEDGITLKKYHNVGITYYVRGESTVPGVMMRSGRHVYDGAIAVSQDMWDKMVSPGDLVWVATTDRWYKVEDTMDKQYQMRIDIYTHDATLAKSGSSKSDIIIVRQPK